eukprot:TRINITY_DN14541_c0_g1_i1.p1 TRINITY_DN14541_c0_g1~~TRINITY_DN14541_c0_g1_i1.p1  ORF type:complete len:217 (-),score=25.77 TRINITY_DN14541_c0_g1_i1:80-637(-)
MSQLTQLSSSEKRRLFRLQDLTHFDVNELELIARQFKELSTKHSLDSFLAAGAFKQSLKLYKVRDNIIGPMFRGFDRDNSHAVDFQEYVQTLSVFMKGSFVEKVRLCFEVWDQDHSGQLSPAELKSLLLSVKEGQSSKALDEEVDFVMSKLDANKDGMISFDEFLKGVNRVPVLNLMFRRCFGEL